MEEYSIKIHELLRMKFSQPITWLRESNKNDATVNWVVLSIEEGRPGDLLLLNSDQFTSDIMDQINAQGLAAVLLIGNLPNKIDAHEINIPVAVVDVGTDIREHQRELLNILMNRQTASMERGTKIHFQLSKLAAEGKKIDGVIRAMYELTGKGVLIQDKRLQIISEIPSQELLPIWGDIAEHLIKLDNLPESLQNRDHAGKQNIILSQEIPGGITRIIVPIIVGDVARGYLSLIGMQSDFDSLDHLVAEEGALVCAIEMARTKAVRETEKRLQVDLLTALLQEDLSPRDAGLWVQTMGLDQTQEHTAIQFAWDSPSAPSRRRLETLINGEVLRLGARVILSPTGSNVICFCQVMPGERRPELVLELGASVLERAREEFQDAQVRCGVGSPAANLNYWQTSFREASFALEMAFRLKKSKLLYYPDLLVYHLLMLIETDPSVMKFQEETLGALFSGDGDSDLIETLEVFYENQGNLSQAADALFIHRNTLSYRLVKISDMTGLDLKNPDISLAVQLALKIHRMTADI